MLILPEIGRPPFNPVLPKHQLCQCCSHVLYVSNVCTGKPTHHNIQQRNVSINDLGKTVVDEAGMCFTPVTLRLMFLAYDKRLEISVQK